MDICYSRNRKEIQTLKNSHFFVWLLSVSSSVLYVPFHKLFVCTQSGSRSICFFSIHPLLILAVSSSWIFVCVMYVHVMCACICVCECRCAHTGQWRWSSPSTLFVTGSLEIEYTGLACSSVSGVSPLSPEEHLAMTTLALYRCWRSELRCSGWHSTRFIHWVIPQARITDSSVVQDFHLSIASHFLLLLWLFLFCFVFWDKHRLSV